MKTPAILLLVTLLLAPSLVQAAPFEGRVLLQRTETPGEASTIIYSIKGDRVRVEVIRERVNSFLTDTTKKETTVVMEDDMAYLILASLAPLPDGPKLEKTGEATKLLGVPVQKYVLTSDEGKSELWLAEGFGLFAGFGEGFEKPPAQKPNVDLPEPVVPWEWEYALGGQPLFPLRVVTRDATGREIFRLEVKEVTPAPLDLRLFSPSRNYKKLDTWPMSPD